MDIVIFMAGWLAGMVGLWMALWYLPEEEPELDD